MMPLAGRKIYGQRLSPAHKLHILNSAETTEWHSQLSKHKKLVHIIYLNARVTGKNYIRHLALVQGARAVARSMEMEMF